MRESTRFFGSRGNPATVQVPSASKKCYAAQVSSLGSASLDR
jgi:hypothetical protein